MQRPNLRSNKTQQINSSKPQISKRPWLLRSNKSIVKDEIATPANTSRWSKQPPGTQENRRQNSQRRKQPKPVNPSSYRSRYSKHPQNYINTYKKDSKLHQTLAKTPNSMLKLRPAPLGQFRHYLSSTSNIFYEESQEFVTLNRLKALEKILRIALIILIASYWLIGRIQPFPKQKCPSNADCLVYPKCHKGYILQKQQQVYRCVVDPQVTQRAQWIGEAALLQLAQDYGNGDCLSPSPEHPPTLRFRSILHEFQISEPLVQQQLLEYFESNAIQEQHQFVFKYNTIYPLQKKYSLQCSMVLFTRTHYFKWLLIAVVLIGVSSWWMVKAINFQRRAKRVYSKLRESTLRQTVIMVQQFKGTIQREEGKWNDELWRRVDEKRCKEGIIVYFVEGGQLYWKQV